MNPAGSSGFLYGEWTRVFYSICQMQNLPFYSIAFVTMRLQFQFFLVFLSAAELAVMGPSRREWSQQFWGSSRNQIWIRVDMRRLHIIWGWKLGHQRRRWKHWQPAKRANGQMDEWMNECLMFAEKSPLWKHKRPNQILRLTVTATISNNYRGDIQLLSTRGMCVWLFWT